MRRATGPQLELVREVLNRWDPIGVADCVADEYDAYLSGVATLLLERRTREEIADHLHWIETECIGLSGDHQACVRYAEEFLSLDFPPGEY